MKDLIIKGKFIKRELIIWFACFIVANGINVYAIISRNTEWIELITMMHIVLLLSFFMYGILGFFRAISKLFVKNKERKNT